MFSYFNLKTKKKVFNNSNSFQFSHMKTKKFSFSPKFCFQNLFVFKCFKTIFSVFQALYETARETVFQPFKVQNAQPKRLAKNENQYENDRFQKRCPSLDLMRIVLEIVEYERSTDPNEIGRGQSRGFCPYVPMYNPHISLFNKVMFNTFTFTVPCLSKITVKTILRVCSTVLSSVLFIKIFGWIADFF